MLQTCVQVKCMCKAYIGLERFVKDNGLLTQKEVGMSLRRVKQRINHLLVL
jgi:hypothetical protein